MTMEHRLLKSYIRELVSEATIQAGAQFRQEQLDAEAVLLDAEKEFMDVEQHQENYKKLEDITAQTRILLPKGSLRGQDPLTAFNTLQVEIENIIKRVTGKSVKSQDFLRGWLHKKYVGQSDDSIVRTKMSNTAWGITARTNAKEFMSWMASFLAQEFGDESYDSNEFVEYFNLASNQKISKYNNLKTAYEEALYQAALYDPALGQEYSRVTGKPKPPKQTIEKVLADYSDSSSGNQNPYKWDRGAPYAMKWTPWPQGIAKMSGSPFGKSDSGSETGTGPGERWLGWLFSGKVMGGKVSYDIVIDNMKCESKELEDRSSLIRPGTEGLKAYAPSREKLEYVMRQLNEFVKTYRENKKIFDDDISKSSNVIKNIFNQIVDFVDQKYSLMVLKGEVSRESLVEFRRILQLVNKLKDAYAQMLRERQAEPPSRYSIKLADSETVDVDRPTFIDVVGTIERSGKKTKSLETIPIFGVALDILKGKAYDNPEEWFDDFSRGIELSEVFSQVEGVFITNEEKGFYWIPINKVEECLQFNSISQGKPKFAFLYFDQA